jgi:hypothetical protein
MENFVRFGKAEGQLRYADFPTQQKANTLQYVRRGSRAHILLHRFNEKLQ